MNEMMSVWKAVRTDVRRSRTDETHYFEAGVTAEHVKAVLIEEGYITDQDEVYLDSEFSTGPVPEIDIRMVADF